MIMCKKSLFLIAAFFFTLMSTVNGQSPAATTTVNLNGKNLLHTFGGLGAIPSYEKLLYDYPEPQRSEMLDYLFLPNYGAALQVLKVEIGYDGNNTAVAWASYKRSLNEQPDFNRGYVWWLMKEAKKRNPDILLSALHWGYPAWAKTNEQKAEFIFGFVKGAKEVHGLHIDYIGGNMNEEYTKVEGMKQQLRVNPAVTIHLRKLLNANGFKGVKIVAADEGAMVKEFLVLDSMANNPAYADAVDVIGVHYKSRATDFMPAKAFDFGKEVWSSEDGGGGYRESRSGYTWVSQIIRLLLDVKMNGLIRWSATASVYDNMPWSSNGFMEAKEPWSGRYVIGSNLWAFSHFTQFIQPGWKILDTKGSDIYKKDTTVAGRFITFKDDKSGHYAMLLNTYDPKFPAEGVDMEIKLSGGLSTKTASLWRSDFMDPSAWFRKTETLRPVKGKIRIHLDKGCVYTLSTITNQHRGTTDIPSAKPFPFPYQDAFETAEPQHLAKYFIDGNGIFETSAAGGGREGMALRQVVREAPIIWHDKPLKQPVTEIGGMAWSNYEVAVDVLLENDGKALIGGRFDGKKENNGNYLLEGYWLSIDQKGNWQLLRKDAPLDKNDKKDTGAFVTLASGAITGFGLNKWINLRMEFDGEVIRAFVGQEKVAEVADNTYTNGNITLGTLAEDATDLFSKTDTWCNAQFDNLDVSPIPAKKASLLKNEFMTPPEAARPWVYWFWVNGNLTKQGITADLEAMKRVGIGGVIIMEVDKGEPKGAYAFGSPEWRELFAFMLDEASRLELKVNMNNDGGWCGSGGPWVPVDKSMQKLVWSETMVQGSKRIEEKLPQPKAVDNYYQDIVTLAFPTPEDDVRSIADYAPEVKSSSKPGPFDAKKLMDNDIRSQILFPRPIPEAPQYLDFIFDKPFVVNGVTIRLGGKNWVLEGVLQVSENGVDFKDIKTFKGFAPSISFEFTEQQATRYRLRFNHATKPGTQMQHIGVCEIEMWQHQINNLDQKAMFSPPINTVSMPAEYPAINTGFAVPANQVLNISDKMKSDGTIVWEVPQGKWTILRIGHTTTGKTNHTSPKAGAGYECDRLSKEASTLHFNNLIGKLADESKDNVGKTFVSTHVDSWESGSQNWTPGFIAEFNKRRGYDPLPYLPVMTGQIIGNKEISERFLWDVRATISDLMLENYTDNMLDLAHQKGLKLSIEGYRRCLTDEITYGGRADEPMAEFWAWPRYNFDYSCTQMASSAHVYGKKIVGAEAFTSGFDEAWQGHPANLKELGDWAFCEGINRLVIHRYAMQPYENIKPGMGMSATGLHYERTQTWWEQSTAWHQYLSRCQYVLQQGMFVADMCLLTPEFLPQQWFSPYERDSSTYKFDACSPEVVLTRMSVKDGLIMLPDGMNYKILVMPVTETMSPKLLRKIKELVADGATLVGAPPKKALGLTNYPESDKEVQQIVAELWGRCDGVTLKENRYGKGRVICGKSPEEVLSEMKVQRDFTSGEYLRFIHKQIDGAEVYFVANPKDSLVNTICQFRVQGMQPEIWYPMTGEVVKVTQYEAGDGYVKMPLSLEATGSVFVVFHPENNVKNSVKKLFPDGKITNEVKRTAPPVVLSGPWEVHFIDGMGAPANTTFNELISWPEHADKNIQYYSGTAVYNKTMVISKEMIGKNKRLTLDLGKVAVMAEVIINGQNLGILWKNPFSIDITNAVKVGKNTVEIKVVNLWINRLIGDEQLPDPSELTAEGNLKSWPEWVLDGKPNPTGRYTFTTWKLWEKEAPLVESGLIGPVNIISEVR